MGLKKHGVSRRYSLRVARTFLRWILWNQCGIIIALGFDIESYYVAAPEMMMKRRQSQAKSCIPTLKVLQGHDENASENAFIFVYIKKGLHAPSWFKGVVLVVSLAVDFEAYRHDSFSKLLATAFIWNIKVGSFVTHCDTGKRSNSEQMNLHESDKV